MTKARTKFCLTLKSKDFSFYHQMYDIAQWLLMYVSLIIFPMSKCVGESREKKKKSKQESL